MKIFKKIAIFALLVLFSVSIVSQSVKAASNDILTISATGTTTGATVSGSCGDDVVAIVIEIFDDQNQLLAMQTYPAANGSYGQTIPVALVVGKTYTAYVVNYDGSGTPQETDFTVTDDGNNGGSNGGSGSGNNGTSGNMDTGSPSGDTGRSTGDNGSGDDNSTDGNAGNDANGDSDEASPKTGDDSNVVIYLMMIAVGTMLIGASTHYNNKKAK